MERLAQVWARHNSHPLKSLASLMIQAPVFICFFSALRHMAAAQARHRHLPQSCINLVALS